MPEFANSDDVEQAVRLRLCVSHMSSGSPPGRQGLVPGVCSPMHEEDAGT